MKSIQSTFGNNCRRIRNKNGFTQEEVAERSGLSLSYISELERGNSNPTLTTMERLAKSFDAELAELLEFKHGHASPQEIRQRLIKIIASTDAKTLSDLYFAILRAFNP